MIVSPKDILLPYQRRWVDDESRFKIGMWARQTGKSFAGGGELVIDSLKTPKTFWVVLSAGERQALEFMTKVKEWTEACASAMADYKEERSGPEALIKSAEVKWPNGSRCLALPANPNTARGYSANLLLDEFAFHEDPDAIWKAIYPSISNPIKGIKRIRITSTPNGKANKFADLMLKENKWSKHTVTIYDAVREGLKVNVDELRAGLDDPDAWAQEYECQFLDSAAVLLPYELIATCESPESTEVLDAAFWEVGLRKKGERALYAGLDFGRKRDLTVFWLAELLGDVLHTREVLTLSKTPTPEQVALLSPRISQCRRVCLDYTGAGVGLGDYLAKAFGEWHPEQDKFGKVELCNFSNAFKLEVFPRLKAKFESRGLRIPVSRAIREDLHSISRVVTPTGAVSYRAPHTDDGHSDRCTALALCVRAGGTGGGPFVYRKVDRDGAEDRESFSRNRGRRFGA
jgi:phage FluMu gp28-like protein